MSIEDVLSQKIRMLLDQVPALVRVNEYDQLIDSRAVAECVGWISAASNLVQIACSSAPQSGYLAQADELRQTATRQGFVVHQNVLSFASLLKHLQLDIQSGLLKSLERQLTAETFDDLLDHAEVYLGAGRKDPAAVVAGVVFEDTIRRLCRVNNLSEEGKTGEPMINALVTAGILTKLEGKEAKMASGLRDNATHAFWDKFNNGQVDNVIRFTKRLLRDKLSK